jgi:hypothetical protein
MAHGLVMLEWTVDAANRPSLVFDDTDLAASWTDPLGAQRLGLLERSGFQGSR